MAKRKLKLEKEMKYKVTEKNEPSDDGVSLIPLEECDEENTLWILQIKLSLASVRFKRWLD